MKFLKARWQHLLFANYAVEKGVLEPFVPKGTVIDEFNGSVFVSLVAFMFNRTRVLGVPIPFHVRFEEANLRFYVSPAGRPEKRAVTFIKEIVPRSMIPLIANNLFHENYIALPMTHENSKFYHSYSWTNAAENSISGRITRELAIPPAGSMEEFITEHYWGYANSPRGTLEYRVEHPQWQCCQLEQWSITVDFASNYGEDFRFLSKATPYNVLYAEGSDVSVLFPRLV